VRVAFIDNPGVASTAADGSQLVQLSPAGWSSFDLLLVVGTEVLFEGFLSGTGNTIYRAPIDGSQSATALFPAGSNIVSFLLASPTEVAFIRSFSSGARQLSVVPLAGGTPVPLHALPPAGRGPIQVVPHPDGQRVLFRADNDTAGVFELYVAPLDASSAPMRLNGPLASNEDVWEMKVTPDEAHAAFRAGIGNGGQVELFQAVLDASSLLQLNEPSLVGNTLGDVVSFRVTPDRASLVYRADQEADDDFDLYALDTSAAGSPLQLSSGLPNVLPEFAFSPLSERVAFQTQGAAFALHGADLAGGSPIALDTSTVAFASGFEVSPDGTRLVYRRHSSGLNFELCSVAMDGLSAPVVLHAPLSTDRTVSQFQISPGGVVVFLTDLGQDEVFELYAVPIDGSAQPLRLNQTLVAGGNVTSFQIDANGVFAVYLADARANNRFELYRVPLDNVPRSARSNRALATSGLRHERAHLPQPSPPGP
jgi:hypothetical protein